MKTNIPKPRVPAARTHEGAVADTLNVHQQLSRLTMTSMLWESGFYESGKAVAERVAELIPSCETTFLVGLTIAARTEMKLRHMPLLMAREMARCPRHQTVVGELLPQIILRADELAEFLAIYWKDGKQPLSAQVKKGLAASFSRFNEYQLAKYNRDGAVKLRDVAFLSHAKAWDGRETKTKVRTYKENGVNVGVNSSLVRHTDSTLAKLVEGRLETPDTWEVELSAGKDKAETFVRLMGEKKLGALAFLRNLRNMTQAGIATPTLAAYAAELDVSKVLPFRFIAAARHAPAMEPFLEPLMFKALDGMAKLPGRTCLLVDISGSMDSPISAKSDLNRLDAACGLTMLLRELCEDIVIGKFNDRTELVPPRRGFALRDAIGRTRGGTRLRQAVEWAGTQGYDRLIVLTDEQSTDRPAAPRVPGKGYVINVAANRNGVGYGPWNHVDGWSEAVVAYIQKLESQ